MVRRVPARGGRRALVVPRRGRRARGQGAQEPRARTASSGMTRHGRRPTSPGTRARATNGLWTDTPTYEWSQPVDGNAVSYVSEPLAEDTTVPGRDTSRCGSAPRPAASIFRRRSPRSVPTTKEVFVQGGWLRGSMRKLDKEKSTPLEPVLSLRKSDMKPLRDDRFVKATIPLYYQGHGYREGSRIRVIDLGGRRRPADLGVCQGPAEEHAAGRRRVRQVDALEADPAGPAQRGHPDRAAALPGSPRRALPRLRSVRERGLAAPVAQRPQTPARVKVTCVTPLGDGVTSTS